MVTQLTLILMNMMSVMEAFDDDGEDCDCAHPDNDDDAIIIIIVPMV